MQQENQSNYNLENIIEFSENWNRKLSCHFFTTIRLKNDKKFVLGQQYKIFLKGEYVITANLLQKIDCHLKQLPPVTCYLDTGYGKQETVEMLKKMYKNKVANFDTQLFTVLLLENIDYLK